MILTNDPEDRLAFKNMKTTTKKLINDTIKQNMIKLYKSNENDPRKIWKLAKNDIFEEQNELIDRIFIDNKLYNGSKAGAEQINIYFQSKVNQLIAKIPKPTENPMKHYMKHIKTPTKLLMFKTINLTETKNIIGNLKNSNSSSIDQVSGKMLKKIKDPIAPLVMNLINQCILQHKFPKITKITKILPKWKNRTDLTHPQY